MGNRKRDKVIKLRMTEMEKNKLDSEYAKTRFNSRADFVLALVDKRPIVVIDSLGPILAELRRQGNNLNQIAHKINAANGEDVQPMAQLISRWIEAYDRLIELEQEIRANAAIQRNKQ